MSTVKNPPRKIKLNIGGELCTGDVVGVAYNNYTAFGWFVESGAYGSLKFITLQAPKQTEDSYKQHLADPSNKWLAQRFIKGFQFKNITKDYIIAFGPNDNRAFKVPNPEEFFKGSAQEQVYEESRKILTDINFPAK